MTTTLATERQAAQVPAVHAARKTYWVLPMLQGRFIAWLVLSTAIIATTVAWAVLLLIWGPLKDQLVYAASGFDYDAFFRDMVARVAGTTGLLIMIFAAVSFVAGLVISHRIAGPLHRLGQVAREARNGRYDARVSLRQYDYIHDFADQFNALMQHFEQRDKSRERAVSSVADDLRRIQRAVEKGALAPTELKRELRDSLSQLRQTGAAPHPGETSA